MSHILNRGSVIWWFKRGNAIVIYDRTLFDFYTGLPHIHIYSVDICIYITCDVKGKHDLIIQGWTKSGVHLCTFKHNRFHSFLSGRYGFNLVCYLHLCSH